MLPVIWLLGFTLPLMALPAYAQDQALPYPSKPADHTLLWRIQGPGWPAPSFLFGTMHIMCEDDAVLSDSLKDAIGQCQSVYFEIDMDNLGQMLTAFRYLRMKDGAILSDLLSPQEYQRLEDYFKNRKLPLPFLFLTRFKPFIIAGLLSEQGFDCEKKNGMEMRILKEAKSQNKKIMGLETLEFQASLFDSIPYQDQARDLLKYIDSADQYAQSARLMATVYKEENLERLDSLLVKSDPGMETYMDLLLYDRNRRWVSQISSLALEKPCVFAVGAGHLPGQNGVIRLLRNKGYTVTPVKNW